MIQDLISDIRNLFYQTGHNPNTAFAVLSDLTALETRTPKRLPVLSASEVRKISLLAGDIQRGIDIRTSHASTYQAMLASHKLRYAFVDLWQSMLETQFGIQPSASFTPDTDTSFLNRLFKKTR